MNTSCSYPVQCFKTDRQTRAAVGLSGDACEEGDPSTSHRGTQSVKTHKFAVTMNCTEPEFHRSEALVEVVVNTVFSH